MTIKLHQFWWWNREFCFTFLKLLRTNVSIRFDFALRTSFLRNFSCNQFPSNIFSTAKKTIIVGMDNILFNDHEQNESTFSGETFGFTGGLKKFFLTTLRADESLILTGRKREVFFERTKIKLKKTLNNKFGNQWTSFSPPPSKMKKVIGCQE